MESLMPMTAQKMILATGQSVDFMIHGLIEFELFGQKLWITTTHVSLLIVMGLIIAFALFVRSKLKAPDETPGLLQSGVEVAIEMLENMVSGVMGSDGAGFVNYIGSIFAFILISNISGLFGLRPPTADFGVTLPLGLITFLIISKCGCLPGGTPGPILINKDIRSPSHFLPLEAATGSAWDYFRVIPVPYPMWKLTSSFPPYVRSWA